MDREDHKKVKEIFNAALQKEPAERGEYLDEMCGDNEELSGWGEPPSG